MPRGIFLTATTLNGFLADDQDSLEWLFAVPDADSAMEAFPAFLARIGALAMGSTTFRWVAEHEHLDEQPQRWSEFYGDRPTFVFSTRSDLPVVPDAGIEVVSGAVAEHWPRISAAAGDLDVWLVGGGDLVGQFDDAGHLDEMRISIAPATLAAGRPLLPRRIGSDRLHLEQVAQAGQFAELRYTVARKGTVEP